MTTCESLEQMVEFIVETKVEHIPSIYVSINHSTSVVSFECQKFKISATIQLKTLDNELKIVYETFKLKHKLIPVHDRLSPCQAYFLLSNLLKVQCPGGHLVLHMNGCRKEPVITYYLYLYREDEE